MCWMASTEQSLPTVKLATLDAFYISSNWMWFDILRVLFGALFPISALQFWYPGSGKTFTITGGAENYEDRGLIPRTLRLMFEATLHDAMMRFSPSIVGKEAIWAEKARTDGWSKLDRLFERDQPNTACTSRTWRYTRTLRCLFPIVSSVSACGFRSGPLNPGSRWAFQDSNYQ